MIRINITFIPVFEEWVPLLFTLLYYHYIVGLHNIRTLCNSKWYMRLDIPVLQISANPRFCLNGLQSQRKPNTNSVPAGSGAWLSHLVYSSGDTDLASWHRITKGKSVWHWRLRHTKPSPVYDDGTRVMESMMDGVRRMEPPISVARS